MTTQQRSLPSLPQHNSAENQLTRAFDVRQARTRYNYMTSYLEPLPFSADVPKGEAFSLDYDAKIAPVFRKIASNYVTVMQELLEREFRGAFSDNLDATFAAVRGDIEACERDPKLERHLEIIKSLLTLCSGIEKAAKNLAELPGDIRALVGSIKTTFAAIEQQGGAGFLKYGLYDIVNPELRPQLLAPTSADEYRDLYKSFPLPETVLIEPREWMQLGPDEQPWQQDWFLGYQQIAGFNTTQLQGVTLDGERGGVGLAALLEKFPISDAAFQRAVGEPELTLADAAKQGRLYICDYKMLDGVPSGVVFGERRYHGAPIALFYWSTSQPRAYPPLNESTPGVMMPVGIQLEQVPDPVTAPIFTPHDGERWAIAKFLLQNACAIEHETIAHLGDTHLTVEPMIVASHRQLSALHPIMTLLVPHFRFTIAINNAALQGLVVPGGTLAANLSTSAEGSLDMVRNAHLAWRFDEQVPTRLFEARGVSAARLPSFPFRDDTLLLWEAIHDFVGKYLRLYYTDEASLLADYELQAWITEMVVHAKVRGMDGLVSVGTPDAPKYEIRSLDYLTQVVAQIIYIAGPLHASVNYAQFPLMSFSPSVSVAAFQPPPTADSSVSTPLAWLPPMDIALYQVSFTYLLSNVQYDTLGVYTHNPREPYFADLRAEQANLELQSRLLEIELEIRRRNRSRPIPYQFQMPSRVPNSISI